MQIKLPQATYVVAVSGGVDSVVLLDLAVKNRNAHLVVAHFNHGMRDQSHLDADFVAELARSYQLEFVTERATLGKQASEATARAARYQFLNAVRQRHQAEAILTAHHQDDWLETAIINFKRGCKRHGYSSLQSTGSLQRPLLMYSKEAIVAYAQQAQLSWREDASNTDLHYLRNYIRAKILPKFTSQQRQQLLQFCQTFQTLNQQFDHFLENYLRQKSYRRQNRVFARLWFNQLTHAQACEVVAFWLGDAVVHSRQIEYIVVKLKTLLPGKLITVRPNQYIRLTKRCLRLEF